MLIQTCFIKNLGDTPTTRASPAYPSHPGPGSILIKYLQIYWYICDQELVKRTVQGCKGDNVTDVYYCCCLDSYYEERVL